MTATATIDLATASRTADLRVLRLQREHGAQLTLVRQKREDARFAGMLVGLASTLSGPGAEIVEEIVGKRDADWVRRSVRQAGPSAVDLQRLAYLTYDLNEAKLVARQLRAAAVAVGAL